MLVDPGQFDLELLGGEADGAEDADATGVGDGGDDVAAVGEGEDGELDAQLAADLGVHGQAPLWDGRGLVGHDRCRLRRRSAGGRRPVGSPTRAHRPPHDQILADHIRVQPVLHGQAGQKGRDQHGQLLGVGSRAGARPGHSTIPIGRAELAGRGIPLAHHVGDLAVARAPEAIARAREGPTCRIGRRRCPATLSHTAAN